LNRLIERLAEVCRQRRLEEKWLLAPSMRIGHQWLACAARAGQPAINVRVKTLKSMVLDLAGPEMAHAGVELASQRAAEILVDRIFRRLGPERLRYLGQLRASAGLAETIQRSIQALRLTGLEPDQIDPRRFEVATKGREVLLLLREYLAELQTRRWVDYADVLQMAIRRTETSETLAPHVLVLCPADLRVSVLEQELLARLPATQLVTLEVDEPQPLAERLPIEPSLFHALGEVNEVREVLRRALAEGVPLDEIELLTSDAETYVPLVYETLAALVGDDETADEDLPLTLSEGLPCRYSRPGRLLAAWVAWLREGLVQDRLVKMVREGLLAVPESQGAASMPRLAAVLRGVGIGAGRERYLVVLDRAIAAAKRPRPASDDDEASEPQAHTSPLGPLETLRSLVAALLETSPADDADPKAVLAAARNLLEHVARTVNKTDNYASEALIKEIDDLLRWASGDEPLGIDPWQWLAALPGQTQILGSGPRPGCLHVASIFTGGHSGRAHTYLVGLDEGRFPGSGTQDPLLLDAERRAIDERLPTAASQLDERLAAFQHLLARLRGQVTLSYSCHDLVDDRPRFPSPLLVAIYRRTTGRDDATQHDLIQWLDRPASFAPLCSDGAISPSEWWLWRLCGPAARPDDAPLVLRSFANLTRAAEAARCRASTAFTDYDGRVPDAGEELDPTADGGPVMSSSKLERAGRCGLAYFFQCGLGVRKPDELELDPQRWLNPLAAGSLLHTVFERFFRARLQRNEAPSAGEHWPELQAFLDEVIADYRQAYPPPSEAVYQAQCRQFRRAAWIMLTEEEEYCRSTGSRPVYLEACLGLPSGAGTPLDHANPIPVDVGEGRSLRACGKVDRIDHQGGNDYAIWDYKTGSAWAYRPGDPFRQGRVVQPALYVAMVQRRLKELVPGARVRQFGFFFPSERERGRRVAWNVEQLADGRQVLAGLTGMIREGAFLPTSDADDCKFCDYLPICGDPSAVAAASQVKLAAGDPLLAHTAGLRGHGQS
jgi:RecB family exonuclease